MPETILQKLSTDLRAVVASQEFVAKMVALGVEPQSTGIGGDCFVLYSRGGALPVALNGSGRAPAKANVEWYVEHGIREIEVPTPHAVTVPGAVDAN